jgi:hypothetical protein
MFSVAATLPAMRVTNRSPNPWSNTISIGTRESAQPRNAAKGVCPGRSKQTTRVPDAEAGSFTSP